MPSGFPDFDRPPVTEVVIGVQFDPLTVTSAHFGLLWLKFKEKLPRLEEKAPLLTTVERFGVLTPQREPKISLLKEVPVSRVWFSSEARDELVQVQRDRFMFNWRKLDSQSSYPRYEVVEKQFLRGFSLFVDFLAENGLGEASINQCEVTYVNYILPAEGVWRSHDDVGKVVTLLADVQTSYLPRPEELRSAARFQMRDRDQKPFGRLHVQIEPRFLTENNDPLILLQLTARGTPLGEGLEGAKTFLRLGREWIVKGFVDVTSPEMHKVWGKR